MAKQANCRFCFDNPEVAKHLIISIGTHVSFTWLRKNYIARKIFIKRKETEFSLRIFYEDTFINSYENLGIITSYGLPMLLWPISYGEIHS